VWIGAAVGVQYTSWWLARYAGIVRRREAEITPCTPGARRDRLTFCQFIQECNSAESCNVYQRNVIHEPQSTDKKEAVRVRAAAGFLRLEAIKSARITISQSDQR